MLRTGLFGRIYTPEIFRALGLKRHISKMSLYHHCLDSADFEFLKANGHPELVTNLKLDEESVTKMKQIYERTKSYGFAKQIVTLLQYVRERQVTLRALEE
jgi:hypothetical protein